MTTKRELRIVNMATGEVVFRQDVTSLDREQREDAAAKLKAKIDETEFYVEDSGAPPIGGEG